MIFSALALALIGLVSQEAPEEGPSLAPERIRVLVIEATDSGGAAVTLDPNLAPLRDYLLELPYATFKEAGFHDVEAPYGVETAIEIDERFSVYCEPRSLTDTGDVVFDAHIDVKEGDSTLEALRISGQAARGSGVVFRGLELPGGELIVVLSVAKAREPGGGAGGSAGQQDGQDSDSGGGQDSDSTDSGDGQDGDGEMQDRPEDPALPESEPAPEDGDEPALDPEPSGEESPEEEPVLPPELANVEAILQTLEDIDQKEQEKARKQRYDVIMRGDWW